MDKLSARFLSAFNDIDRFMRRVCGAGEAAPFHEVVDLVAEKSVPVRTLKSELKNYGRLRNAIVHNFHDDETIATPHERVVKRIETVKGYLLAPPTIGSLFNQKVTTCGLETPVVKAVKQMSHAGYSQLPVYQQEEFLALLTTNTIARWLAATFDRDGGVLDETPVEAVLCHAEDTDNFSILGQNNTVFDATEHFAAAARNGKRLDAIVVTADGTKHHLPVGIVTLSDVPKLYKTIQ